MHFSQKFHVQISRAQDHGMWPVRWILDHEAFSYLEQLMEKHGGRFHPTSRILGLPFEIGEAPQGHVELICICPMQDSADNRSAT